MSKEGELGGGFRARRKTNRAEAGAGLGSCRGERVGGAPGAQQKDPLTADFTALLRDLVVLLKPWKNANSVTHLWRSKYGLAFKAL